MAGFLSFRERTISFCLDFQPFRPSVLDGARSKVDLGSKGYVWASIGGVPTTPRGRDLFPACDILWLRAMFMVTAILRLDLTVN